MATFNGLLADTTVLIPCFIPDRYNCDAGLIFIIAASD